MIPNQTLSQFPEFANNGTKIAPDEAKYAIGMLPADVLPAEWVNYFFNGATKGITALNAGVKSIEEELNNVLSNRSIEPSADNNAQLLAALQSFKAEAILAAHPIGSLFWTSVDENPAVSLGGTWKRITNRFVLAASDPAGTVTYANGATGGAATVTLTTEQIPSHTHTFTGSSATTASQSTSTTGNESAHEKFSWTGSHGHQIASLNVDGGWGAAVGAKTSTAAGVLFAGDNAALNSRTAYIDSNKNYNPIIKTTSITASGTCTGDHTHSYAHTHTLTAKGSNANTGGGQAHNNMPPYIAKFCWERTA